MVDYQKIFNALIGKHFLFAYERLLELNPPEDLCLTSLCNIFNNKIDDYLSEIRISWIEEIELQHTEVSPENIIAVEKQYEDLLQEIGSYLEKTISKYPKVNVLWQMDRIIQTKAVIYDWDKD